MPPCLVVSSLSLSVFKGSGGGDQERNEEFHKDSLQPCEDAMTNQPLPSLLRDSHEPDTHRALPCGGAR